MSRILSAQEILERQRIERAAETKAADPATLTDEDLKVLSIQTFRRLASDGALGHLGVGKPRGTRRNR